ncbi:MAG: tRNA preQ1(34) S-adenosylmethionine ribosyltransferase-isomerase QueA [Planctomycetaceae bacterium]|jgi:S-adenosylmethionine:tRNA ribosyltransferase-isomerase
MNDLADYDYTLPERLIARQPADRRDQARLLVVDRATGRWFHHHVSDLPGLLRAGDQLVLNDTRVLPARLKGHRAQTGGRWEGLFLGETTAGHWRLMGRTRGRLQPGECLKLEPWPDSPLADAAGPAPSELRLRLVAEEPGGFWLATPEPARPALAALTDYGTMPLPPYMERETPGAADFERYQTVYARVPGSVAAPTAGLHFTPELLARCQQAGIRQSFVTLHVGVGTFRPIAVERLEEHDMHSEWCELPGDTAATLQATRAAGGRIVAVGTTSVRTLESAPGLDPAGWRGETRLFIRPPHSFRHVDALLTNFHLPKSTLLVLISAFAGGDLIRAAYAEAIREEYRFFSYGDAMLLL